MDGIPICWDSIGHYVACFKEFLMGNGESLFDEMSEEPAYVLDLVLWSIPIQKFKYLERWSDLETVFLMQNPVASPRNHFGICNIQSLWLAKTVGLDDSFYRCIGYPIASFLDLGWRLVHQWPCLFTIGLSTFVTLCLSRAYGYGTHIIYGHHMQPIQSFIFTKCQNSMVQKPFVQWRFPCPFYITSQQPSLHT